MYSRLASTFSNRQQKRERSNANLVADDKSSMKKHVLRELLSLSNDDIQWIFDQVVSERPGLKLGALKNDASSSCEAVRVKGRLAGPRSTLEHLMSSLGAQVKTESDLLYRALRPHMPDRQRSTIQRAYAFLDVASRSAFDMERPSKSPNSTTHVRFFSGETYCKKGDAVVDIKIQRVGDLSVESSVKYHTADDTYYSGRHYVAKTGTIIFNPGEDFARVSIDLRSTTSWTGFAVFQVCLSSEGVHNCTVDSYLACKHVKILERSTFPSDKCKNILRDDIGGGIESMGWRRILFEYIRLNFSYPQIKAGTLKRILVGQLHNVFLLLNLFCQVYILDYTIDVERPLPSFWAGGQRKSFLVVLAFIQVFGVLVIHIFENLKFMWSCGGPSRKLLMHGILMAYMNYDHKSSMETDRGQKLTMGLTRDAVDLVSQGYKQAMKLLQVFGKVFVLVLFKLVSPAVFGVEIRPALFLPFIFLPVIQWIVIRVRESRYTALLREKQIALDEMNAFAHDVFTNKAVIRDYAFEKYFAMRLDELVGKYNAARRTANNLMLNNHQVMVWMTAILIGWWTIHGGLLVIEQSLSVGLFATTFRVYSKVGAALTEVYDVVLSLQNVVPALIQICSLMNAPSDLEVREDMRKHNKEETYKKSQELSIEHPSDALDHMTICLEDISFAFSEGGSDDEERRQNTTTQLGLKDANLMLMGNIEISQGSLACFVGAEGEGKTTLLKLIGGHIAAKLNTGKLFIPSHLRIVHMMSEPLFFRGDLLFNLTVGCKAQDDAEPVRVQQILDKLCLPKHVNVDCDTDWDWKHVFTITQLHKLNLARALVANPLVLCSHRPTIVYDETNTDVVMRLLTEFVRDRGVQVQRPRRPRTCIYTSSSHQAATFADDIFVVQHGSLEKHSHSVLSEFLYG